MIKAVIFDMYETLITHFESPLYFCAQMALDAGIEEHRFRALWEPTEHEHGGRGGTAGAVARESRKGTDHRSL